VQADERVLQFELVRVRVALGLLPLAFLLVQRRVEPLQRDLELGHLLPVLLALLEDELRLALALEHV